MSGARRLFRRGGRAGRACRSSRPRKAAREGGASARARSPPRSAPWRRTATAPTGPCCAWMVVKRSENGNVGGVWLEGHGLPVGSEALGLASRVRRAAASLRTQSEETVLADRCGLAKTATLTIQLCSRVRKSVRQTITIAAGSYPKLCMRCASRAARCRWNDCSRSTCAAPPRRSASFTLDCTLRRSGALPSLGTSIRSAASNSRSVTWAGLGSG